MRHQILVLPQHLLLLHTNYFRVFIQRKDLYPHFNCYFYLGVIMKKIKKKLLSTVVVLIFLISLSTAINATDIQKPRDKNSYDIKILLKENDCDCQNLDEKYPVMTDRSPAPKTKITNEDPEPTGSFGSLPSQFSWKSYGGNWMTPVKDQDDCGSCWDFSAIGTMEAAINLASGYPDTDLDLSEQYVLSCLPYGGGCNGGWTDDAFEAIISTDTSIGNGINGVPLESCMPYQAKDYIPCSDKCADWDTYHVPPEEDDILWQLESWGANHNFENDNPSDRDTVKSWLIDKGPLSVSMYATNSFKSYWESHHSPDDWYFEEDHGYTNHAVVLVGWVDDPDVDNGGYWILKNSWGTSWGYGGYFNAAYGGQDIAEIVRWCKTPDWPEQEQGPGPVDVDMAVFSDFDLQPEYPHPGEEIEFTDMSDGDVALRKWDFNGDGTIDSNDDRPTWTYNEEGEYEVYLEVWSEWGLHSNRTKIVEVKNNWPPVIEGLPMEFVGHGLNYHFDARYCYDPDGTITDYLWDFDDGTTSDEKYLDHTFPEGDVIYEVALTLTDNDGGTSSDTCQLKIDQTVPPVTIIQHGIESDGSDWYRTTQRISFSATDWTEVIDTFYRIDGGSWIRYVPSEQRYIPVGDEGEHTVEAYSVDYYGNEEDPVSETFWIDKTEPTVDASFSGDEEDGWYINKVEVTISGEDELSGIDKFFYRYKTSDWIEYNGPFTIDDRQGVFILHVMAVDNAGNQVTGDKEVRIKNIDGPTIPTIQGPTSGEKGEELTYNTQSFDPGNEVSYYVDWGDGDEQGWLGPYSSGEKIKISHTYNSEDIFVIKVKAKNQHDVESDWGTLSVSTPKSKNIDRSSFLFKLLEDNPLILYLLKYLFYR